MVFCTAVYGVGLVMRVMITSESEIRGYAAAGVVSALNFGGGWAWWVLSAKSVYGFSWKEANPFHIGAWGFISQKKFKKHFPGKWFNVFGPKRSYGKL